MSSIDENFFRFATISAEVASLFSYVAAFHCPIEARWRSPPSYHSFFSSAGTCTVDPDVEDAG
jgi:hypothetical protein